MRVSPVILLIEPLRRGAAHQAFNASLLLTCHAAFPQHQLVIVAFKDHLEALQESLATPSWLNYVAIPPGYAKAERPWSSSLKQAWLVLSLVRQWHAQALLLTSVTTGLLWSCRVLGLIRKPPRQIIAIFHAGLVSILRPRRLAGLRKLAPGWGVIMLSDKKMQYLVLEKAILQQIAERDPLLATRFKVLSHPLPPDLLAGPRATKDAIKPIKIGFLGLATPQKGLLNFLSMARTAARRFPGDFEFELIGRLHDDYRYLKRECEQWTHHPVTDKVLSRKSFINRVSGLDFAVFLFDGKHYDLTASGVLVDCMALGLPVIARPNALIRQLTEEAGGPLGYSCAEGGEFQLLDQLQQDFSEQQNQQFRLNLLRLAAKRHPECLAEPLYKLLPGLSDTELVSPDSISTHSQ